MRTYLNGFATLRTREVTPPDPSLFPPKRTCTNCGAVLQRGNYGTICCTCWGTVEIPEWAITIVESDDCLATVETIARRIIRANGYETPKLTERNRSILRRYEAGETETTLAEAYGIKPSHIRCIVGRERKRRSNS